jgi:hypothetical protein
MRLARAPVDDSRISQLLEMETFLYRQKSLGTSGSESSQLTCHSSHCIRNNSSIKSLHHFEALASSMESLVDANGWMLLVSLQGGHTEVRFAAAAKLRLAICLVNMMCE